MLPPNEAVIEEVATGRLETDKVALPPDRVPVPSVVDPFLKVTVPVGVPPNAGVTVAVKVTDWPYCEGFFEEARVVVVLALLTVWARGAEVLVR